MIPELPLLALLSPGFLLYARGHVKQMEANAPAARLLRNHPQAVDMIAEANAAGLRTYAEAGLATETPQDPDLLWLMIARADHLRQDWAGVLDAATQALGHNIWLRDAYCLRQLAHQAQGNERLAEENAAYAARISPDSLPR